MDIIFGIRMIPIQFGVFELDEFFFHSLFLCAVVELMKQRNATNSSDAIKRNRTDGEYNLFVTVS